MRVVEKTADQFCGIAGPNVSSLVVGCNRRKVGKRAVLDEGDGCAHELGLNVNGAFFIGILATVLEPNGAKRGGGFINVLRREFLSGRGEAVEVLEFEFVTFIVVPPATLELNEAVVTLVIERSHKIILIKTAGCAVVMCFPVRYTGTHGDEAQEFLAGDFGFGLNGTGTARRHEKKVSENQKRDEL